jgi:hypothetical protein
VFWPELLNRFEHADGQEDDGGDELEHASYGDPGDAEGQQDKPDERIEHEGSERERPAENEEDAPEKEFDHTIELVLLSADGVEAAHA